MKTKTDPIAAVVLSLVELLTSQGFTQGYYHGGPPSPPRSLTDSLALGHGRVAYFEHESCCGYGFAMVDLQSGYWRLLNDGGGKIRGYGRPQLIRALNTTRYSRRTR